MKKLVAYYSRTGTTQRMAKQLAELLDCDIEEIVDRKQRKGIFGFIYGGYEATKEKTTEIARLAKAPCEYDLVILAAPIWASNMPPAMRTYIQQNKAALKKVAFLFTYGGGGESSAISKMTQAVGEPVATVTFSKKELGNSREREKLQEFVQQLQD